MERKREKMNRARNSVEKKRPIIYCAGPRI